MTTYNWNCRTVDCHPQQENESNVVYNVHWRVNGISDQLDEQGNPYSAGSIGTQTLDTSNITEFIPFDQISHEEIVSWTKLAMGEEQVSSIEESIQGQIDAKITPVSITLTITDNVELEEVEEEGGEEVED